MTREEFERYFGMSPERCREIMTEAANLITGACQDVIEHCDYYKHPLDYVDSDLLDETYGPEWTEKSEDSDGFSNLYNFRMQSSAEWLFMRLISFHTTHGGHTSAIEACRLMGLRWRD